MTTGVRNDLARSIVDEQPYPLMFAAISGAHLYGFPSADSDYDLRGVHILPAREVMGLHSLNDTIDWSGVRDGIEMDLVTHDALKFFQLLLKRNGYVLEQLTSPLIVQSSPEHEELNSMVPRILTRHHAHHYLGFARTQWGLFQKDKRVKPLLYVYRVLLTGIHLMRTGTIEANIVRLNEDFNLSYIADLVTQKTEGTEKGTLEGANLAFHTTEYERLTQELEEARDETNLPAEPSCRDELNGLLIRLRMKTV